MERGHKFYRKVRTIAQIKEKRYVESLKEYQGNLLREDETMAANYQNISRLA